MQNIQKFKVEQNIPNACIWNQDETAIHWAEPILYQFEYFIYS